MLNLININNYIIKIVIAIPIIVGVMHPKIKTPTVLFYTLISLPYWFSIIKEHVIIYSRQIILSLKILTLGFYFFRLGFIGIFDYTLIIPFVDLFFSSKFITYNFKNIIFLSWIVFKELSYLNRINVNSNKRFNLF